MGLLMVTLAMLFLAVAVGLVYTYWQGQASPYLPRVQDYLDDQHDKAA